MLKTIFGRLKEEINAETGKRNIGLKRDFGIQEAIDMDELSQDTKLVQKFKLLDSVLRLDESYTVYEITDGTYLIESVNGSYIARTNPSTFTRSEKERIREMKSTGKWNNSFVENQDSELVYLRYHQNQEIGIKSPLTYIVNGNIDNGDRKKLTHICVDYIDESIN